MSFLTGGCEQVALAGLGDVDRQVADPLEVGVDLDRRDDGAQVGGHRLVQGQQLEAAVVDLDVQLVDRLVARRARASTSVGVALDEAAHGHADALLGEAAHLEQPLLQRPELFLEVPDDAFHGGLLRSSRTGR